MSNQNTLNSNSIFSKNYWIAAASNFTNIKMICFAAIIIALRVALKGFRIPLIDTLYITFDSYINALGSIVYGPVMALAVGAVSDTLGCMIAPIGAYFFPFIFVEMSSSFLFALFFWKRELKVSRILLAKFTVNLVCNIIINPIILKWSYFFFNNMEDFKGYNLINTVRIGKNLALFPLEALLITIVLGAFIPVLKRLGLIDKTSEKLKITPKFIIAVVLLTVISIALVLLYVFYLKDVIKAYQIKLF